jgi:hypothetical protein
VRRERAQNILALGLIAAGTAALALRALLAERQTVDDAFIFLRYARSLAAGAGWTFSPGSGTHVEGTSSVVWTLCLALLWRAGLRGLGAAKALSMAFGAAIPAACALAVRPRQSHLALAVPAIALAFDADLATWSVSGMDTPLWALACVVCVGLAAARWERAAALALGALAWVRPEGPLFAAFGVAGLSNDRRSALRLALIAAFPVAILTLLRLAYFGDLVPNTFWAKMNGAADATDYTGGGYIASALERRPMLLVALPIAAVAIEARLRPKPQPRPCHKSLACARSSSSSSPALRVALALLAASFAFAFLAGGDWMPGRRLLVVALPLAAVAAAIAIDGVSSQRLALAACFVLALEAALTFDHSVDQRWRDVEWLDQRVARWRLPPRPFVEPYPLDWMPAHLLHELAPYVAAGGAVAHVDVGELPYVMDDVAFLDGFGLVDRTAGRLAFAPSDPALRAAAREEFFSQRPAVAIVVLNDRGDSDESHETSARPFSPAQAATLEDPRFGVGWRELSRVPTWGGHPCVTFVRRDVYPASRAEVRSRVKSWLAKVPDVADPLSDPF